MHEYLLIAPVPVPTIEEMVNDPNKLQQALAYKTLYWQTNRQDVEELAKEYCVLSKLKVDNLPDDNGWYVFNEVAKEWLPVADNQLLQNGMEKLEFSGIKTAIVPPGQPVANFDFIIFNKIANFFFQKNDVSQQDIKNLKEGFFNIFGKDNNGNYIFCADDGVFGEIPILEEYQKSRFEWLQNFKKQVA